MRKPVKQLRLRGAAQRWVAHVYIAWFTYRWVRERQFTDWVITFKEGNNEEV